MQSTDEILREAIYRWLVREFVATETRLDAEGKVELDGKLWALSLQLANAGLWESLKHLAGVTGSAKAVSGTL